MIRIVTAIVLLLIGVTWLSESFAGFYAPDGRCITDEMQAKHALCDQINDNTTGDFICWYAADNTEPYMYYYDKTAKEWKYFQTISPPVCSPTNPNYASSDITEISPVQGAQIAAAILLVWAVGFAFRLIRKSLNTNDQSYEKE